MSNASDAQLLREYVEHGHEAAFRDIVVRHTDTVYSAALRQVSSPDLARDVAQSVFTDLARKAPSLARTLDARASLVGWLYRSTRFAALNQWREEHRRQARERLAMQHFEPASDPAPEWERIGPVLDEAMADLSDDDREAVLLRFFQSHDFRAIGRSLGLSDDAAQKRVSRALEKLRVHLTRRGVATSAAALSIALPAHVVQAAPAGLAMALSNAALAGSALATAATFTAAKAIAMTTLQKALITATIVAAGLVTPLVIQHQTQVKLRAENQSLRQQAEQAAQLTAENERLSKLLADTKSSPGLRLPAPPMAATTAPVETATDDLRSTNLIAQLLKGGDAPKLTAEQIDSYLEENRRNAASLLAAFRATGDPKPLQEAMEKFPDDPQVAFHAVFKKDGSPEERRQWLETFKRNAPDNALAGYLSALDYFKAGQADEAVQELIATSGRPHFQDYSADSVQNDEEAWRTAGYSVAESKTLASMLLVLPHLIQLKQLSHEMVALANSYRQAGDEASAQTALQMGFNLGQRLDGAPGQALISQLVGIAIQSIALRAMEPNSPFGSGGQTVKDQLDEVTRQRASIRELTSQFDSLQQRMSDQDWISYKDRWRAFGEMAALRWMINKHGQ
jgi:RNA polymerase sigma factor (sigma-70 family)